jgi:SAM-dependent methyltransferase
MKKKQLLDAINRDLPRDIDWKTGAHDYLRRTFSGTDDDRLTTHHLTEPMSRLNTGESGLRGLDEAVQHLFNFANALKLLRLTGGARIMDAACGGGWLTHYMAAMGYEAFGFDIAEDFIALAKRRVLSDRQFGYTQQQAENMFAVHDIESQPLAERHIGCYDAIIVQNALHCLFDPIVALRHLAACLGPTGVILLFENENRDGPVRPEHIDLMQEHRAINRPLTRKQLTAIFEEAGLRQFEFLGQVNGLVCPRDPVDGNLTEALRRSERMANVAICATKRSPIDRVLPGLLTDSRPHQQAELDFLRQRERELVELVNAITSSRSFRLVQFLKRLIGR